MCAGDFNEIVRHEEKLGGAIRHHHRMQLFRDIIDECGFMDLGFIGSQFTWSKHFEDDHSIWERLDKGLANSSWFLKFPSSRVHHLNCSFSDHLPFLINLSGLNQVPRKKKFKFEEMWLDDNRCAEIIEASWHSGLYQFGDDAILKKSGELWERANMVELECIRQCEERIGEKKELIDSSQKRSYDY